MKTNEEIQAAKSRRQKKFELLQEKKKDAGTLKPVKERKMSKKTSAGSVKRLRVALYGSSLLLSLKKSPAPHHINAIDKDEVKLTAEIKKEAKAKLAKVKAMRKLRDAKLIEASKINKLTKAERHAKIAAQKAELRIESKKITDTKKELKAIARADAKKLYLEKKALDRKVIKLIRAEAKSTKLAA